MMASATAAAAALGVLLFAGGAWLLARGLVRARAADRLFAESVPSAAIRRSEPQRLGRWLASAGFPETNAARDFAIAQAAAIGVGASAAWIAAHLVAAAGSTAEIGAVPVLGPALGGLVVAAPIAMGVALAAAPALFVRGARRRRADAIEEDLPLVLELLAALSEAGLGFDAALARVLDAQSTARPLGDELRRVQRDAVAGMRRVESLRRFAVRVDRPVVRNVVSVLVQAEEVGSGIAEALRPLADDLRLARREQALARAEALPDKLVVALVLGFLPGLLYWTLGPSMHQLVTLLDGIQLR